MSGRETDQLLLKTPINSTMGTPAQGFFPHHPHHHHHHQQAAVAEAGFCACIVCCNQASELCSEANDPSNSCMSRTCNGLGATACGILGTFCCFLSVLSICSNDKHEHEHHHHGHGHSHH